MTNEQCATGFDPYAGLGEDVFYVQVERLVDSGVFNYDGATTYVRGGVSDDMLRQSRYSRNAAESSAPSPQAQTAEPETTSPVMSASAEVPIAGMTQVQFAKATVRAALFRTATRSA